MAFRTGSGRERLGEHLAGSPNPLALGSAMRSVSYVQRVALEFSGSLFPHAICLGDVDNDTVSACALQETPGPAQGRGGAREVEEVGRERRLRERPGVAGPESFIDSVNAGASRPNRSHSLVWCSTRNIDD